MNQQTSLGKAFAINKKANIYGTFAEIGAGQETVNFFYRAGLASQTVAKSMSAYDMTFSDEIYGKQARYVCKDRLMNMLNHEYRLLEKRLKKSENNTCFFVFATTAVTSSQRDPSIFSNNQHAWMGLRFQTQPGGKFNDIVFHVNCLDKSRLQQYEALGILGVNLIYASFYYKNNPKKFIESLTENLTYSRVEVHGISYKGQDLKKFSNFDLNLETLTQKLSSLVFFPTNKNSEFLSDMIFNKTSVIIFGDNDLRKEFQKRKTPFLKQHRLKESEVISIQSLPKKKLKNHSLRPFHFPLLVTPDINIKQLKKLFSLYTNKSIFFVISEKDLNNNIFQTQYYKKDSLLKNLGDLFDNETKLLVASQNNSFDNIKGSTFLKDYLLEKKQIIKL